MREIKFRAWDKSSDVMRNDISAITYKSDGNISQIDVVTGADILFPDKEAVLMQYTGLKDKNGKEIYEGDILKRDDIASFKGGIEVVRLFTSRPEIAFGGEYTTDTSALEVIGNIYENPKLLEKS